VKVYFYLQENKFSSASNKSFIGGEKKKESSPCLKKKKPANGLTGKRK